MRIIGFFVALAMVTSAVAKVDRCGCNKPNINKPKQTMPAPAKPAPRQCAPVKPCVRPAGK
ncbi:MAG: hypothetical protein AMXMBFR12_10620 [Candidatus Babeliales bacterium]